MCGPLMWAIGPFLSMIVLLYLGRTMINQSIAQFEQVLVVVGAYTAVQAWLERFSMDALHAPLWRASCSGNLLQ